MRLLITSDCFLPRVDGIAVFLRDLIPHLAKTFDITIIAPDFKGPTPKLPARIVRIPLAGKIADLPFAALRYSRIKREVERADVVLNNTIGTIGASALWAAHKTRTPIVSYIHSFEWDLFALSVGRAKDTVRRFTKLIATRAYRKADRLIFPSEELRLAYQRLGLAKRAKIIPLGIALEKFRPKHSSRKVPVIGYCGRLAREKGVQYLIEAYETLKRETGARLLIVGDGLRTLKWRAKRVGAKVVGAVKDPQKYYPKMDLFVLPSLTETTSLSTMEAMACGLPVVGTPVGLVPEFIRDSQGGLIVPKKDSAALTMAIKHLLDSPSLRQRYGNNARAYALKHFDIKKSAKQLVETLKDSMRE